MRMPLGATLTFVGLFQYLQRRFDAQWLAGFENRFDDGLFDAQSRECQTGRSALFAVARHAPVTRSLSAAAPVGDVEPVAATRAAEQAGEQGAAAAGRASAGLVGFCPVRHELVQV